MALGSRETGRVLLAVHGSSGMGSKLPPSSVGTAHSWSGFYLSYKGSTLGTQVPWGQVYVMKEANPPPSCFSSKSLVYRHLLKHGTQPRVFSHNLNSFNPPHKGPSTHHIWLLKGLSGWVGWFTLGSSWHGFIVDSLFILERMCVQNTCTR